MKPDNNRDKLKLIKSLIILNMLQQPNCIININKKSKKDSTNIKQKNPNNLNPKDKINTEFILPLQEITIVDDSETILPIKQITIVDDSETILPIEQITIVDLSDDKLSMAKLLIILKHPTTTILYYKSINKTLKNTSTIIEYKNN